MEIAKHRFASKMAGKKPFLAMVLVQLIFAGMSILSKAAFRQGMNTFVFVFYRQAIAALVLVPLAIIFGRKTAPPLPFKLLTKIFMLALYGYTFNLNMHNIAIKFTSATVASAAMNLTPVFTFLLALLLRLETVNLKSLAGIAKVAGVAICVAGASVIAFYKGPCLKSLNQHHPLLHGSSSKNNDSNAIVNEKWIIGSFLMVAAAFGWALWIVLQGLLLREYPSKLLSSALTALFSAFQSFLVALFFERQMSEWKLHWDEELLAVLYNGIFVAGLVLYLQTWSIDKKGPVFVAMFYPLMLVFTIACSFFIGEIINLGSVLGGALMVGGLYSVLWGKSKEAVKERELPVEVVQC